MTETEKVALLPSPDGIAAAWKAWREVVGPQAHLGPGPAFKEALRAAYAVDTTTIIAAVREDCAKEGIECAERFKSNGFKEHAVGALDVVAAIRKGSAT